MRLVKPGLNVFHPSSKDRPFAWPVVILFLGLLAAATAGEARAQNISIRGFVTDASDGQKLQGVNVYLRNGSGNLYGAATDTDGAYGIARIPPGSYVLYATFIGYQTFTDSLDLTTGQILTYNITLHPADTELDEVVVESEKETAGAAGITAGMQSVRPGEIELIPTPDVSGDLAGYLTTMPGVVSTGDRGGQLFIRGGEPTQNLVLLDGMLVYQPFHLVGFYSAFPSDLISNTDVYAGGYGGRFGGWLSSVIDVSARSGNKRRFNGSVSAAPFVSGAMLEGPLWKDRVSIMGSWRVSMIEQGAARLIDQPLPFTFYDQFAKVHANLSSNSQFSITALRTYDRGVIGQEAVDGDYQRDEITWRNEAYGARYLLFPARLPMLAELLLSFSHVENEFGPADRPTRFSSARQFNVSADVTLYTGIADVNWGLFVRPSILESDLRGLFQNVETELEYVTEAGAYFEPEFRLGPGLRVEAGVRLQTFPSKGRSYIEPRARAVWDRGVHRFSAAWGVYHQEVVGLSDRRDAGDVFTAWTTSPLGKVPEAMHFIGGYRISPAPWLDLAVEGFYKMLSNLFVSEWTDFPRFTTNLQPASGNVKGIDLRAEVSRGIFYGFVSYGLSDVTYEAEQRSIQYWYGERSKSFHPPHDRRHQVNALATLELAGVDFSVRWQYGSGLPFTEALGFDDFILLHPDANVTIEPGTPRVLYGEPYEGRLPAYHRLDVSIDRTFSLGSAAALTLQGALINGYDRANLLYLDLYTLRRVDQFPFIPSVGLKLEVR